MDDSALRRQQLLKDTKRMYDSGGIPAIHPRYRHIYHDLYDENPTSTTGSFYLRIVI